MIVIGGSLGSMAALHTILRDLPKSFSRPIAVVLHRHKDSDDALMTILQRDIALTVREVVDKEPIQLCCVHIAPSDYHLLVETMCFSLSTDEPVQFARPSIDVLFESAADVYGSEAIAIILTGANRDGAAGAREIRRRERGHAESGDPGCARRADSSSRGDWTSPHRSCSHPHSTFQT
jgi:two-component system chemotaxis response regulator CheB